MTQKPGERACAHCGAPVRAPVDAAPDVPLYCCAGCETVAALVRDNGWQRFYDERDGFSPRPSGALTEVFDSPAYAAAHAHEQADGTVEARFRVGGVRCAACVWLSERAISCQPGVVDAHVSYGTNVATVRYDPRTTRLSSLAATVASLGYTPVEPTLARHADRDDLVRLGVAAFCAMNVMLIHIAIYLGEARGDMAARYLALFSWASLVLATPAVFYSAVPFFRGSWQALRHRLLSMDVPVALAIAVMYAHGVAMAFVGGAGYLDSLTMLVAFLLGGRVLVAQGRDRAANAAEAVLATAPDDADVRTSDGVRTIAAREVMPGMVLVVGAGGRVCADGRVTHGGAFVDISHVTGEAAPVAVGAGDRVPSGAAIVSGALDVRVEVAPAESTVARIGELVRSALDERSPVTRLVDRVAPWFTAGVLLAAAATLVGWTIATDLTTALPVVVAVLVVACPCALALAAPTTLAVGIGAAARRGAFVRSGDALTSLAAVDTLVIDKTGTITFGTPRVRAADPDTLALAASLELGVRHPVARAIVGEAERLRLPIARAYDVESIPGGGVRGTIDGSVVSVTPDGPETVLVSVDGAPRDRIALADVVRPDAAATVGALRLPVLLRSGDHPEVVSRVASEVGIADARGGLRPEEKLAEVVDAQRAGRHVLFVGDGANDAPAMAAATVGVAMGEGAHAAIATADVVVLEPSLAPVHAARVVSLEVQRALKLNARFAIVYNFGAVLLAAFGLITPLISALLMPISSLIVVGNALAVERRTRRSLARGEAAEPRGAVLGAVAVGGV